MMSGSPRQADMIVRTWQVRSCHERKSHHLRSAWAPQLGGGLLDGAGLAHMCSKQLTKVFGIARKHAPLVPNHSPRIFDRFALVRDADNVQPVAISSYGG